MFVKLVDDKWSENDKDDYSGGWYQFDHPCSQGMVCHPCFTGGDDITFGQRLNKSYDCN